MGLVVIERNGVLNEMAGDVGSPCVLVDAPIAPKEVSQLEDVQGIDRGSCYEGVGKQSGYCTKDLAGDVSEAVNSDAVRCIRAAV